MAYITHIYHGIHHSYLSWHTSQDCHIPHRNLYDTADTEGSVTKDVKKSDGVTNSYNQGVCLVELLIPQLRKLLPRERFENDVSLILVIETNRRLESYLKIRQHISREISVLATISQIYFVAIL